MHFVTQLNFPFCDLGLILVTWVNNLLPSIPPPEWYCIAECSSSGLHSGDKYLHAAQSPLIVVVVSRKKTKNGWYRKEETTELYNPVWCPFYSFHYIPLLGQLSLSLHSVHDNDGLTYLSWLAYLRTIVFSGPEERSFALLWIIPLLHFSLACLNIYDGMSSQGLSAVAANFTKNNSIVRRRRNCPRRRRRVVQI